MSRLQGALASLTTRDRSNFCPRPGIGRECERKVRLRANFFPIVKYPKNDIIHYDVSIVPEVPPSFGRLVFAEYEKMSGNVGNIVFDGRKSMYAPRPVAGLSAAPVEFTIVIKEDGGDRERKFLVAIKEVARVNMEQLARYLTGEQTSYIPMEAIQALDVLMRHQALRSMSIVGRSLYSSAGSSRLGGGVEAWTGFHSSVRPSQNMLMLNCDMAATAYYESGPVIDVLASLLNKRDPRELERGMNPKETAIAEKYFKGVKVEVTYRTAMRRKYRVLRLTRKRPGDTKFFNDELKREQSVLEFFSVTYGVKLRYPDLPCFEVGSQQRSVFIPMEVCIQIPGQRFIRKLNEFQTASMIKVAATLPERRMQTIRDAPNRLGMNRKNEYLKNFGVEIGDNLIEFDARVLKAPTLQYGSGSNDPALVPRNGSWNLRGQTVKAGATLESWAIVVFGSQRDFSGEQMNRFVGEASRLWNQYGLKVLNPRPPAVWASPQSGIEATIRDVADEAKKAARGRPCQLVCCILPNTGEGLYAEIKRVGETVLGFPTQCMQSKHLYSPKPQYLANVALKINMKLGGVNWELTRRLPFVSDDVTIVFGADVTHPAPGEKDRPSICALVASLDAQATRYAASVSLQTGRVEIIGDMRNMITELFRAFYKSTNRKPKRVLFFRDGVSEGQFHEVASAEVKALREACASLDPAYCPPVTFIVVQKRHHVRLFPATRGDGDQKGNVMPGTVVDTSITHVTDFDFYLNSHAGLQGTCRSAHYTVLLDQNNFSADLLQNMVYNMCYMFGRATKSVSLCPAAYYADLLAFRARYYSATGWSGESTESERSGGASTSAFANLKDNLKTTMFYV